MVSNNIFNELSKRLAQLSPEAEKIRTQFHTKIEKTLREAFSEFGILTNEEFLSQVEALKRAERRIEELEDMLIELESRINELT